MICTATSASSKPQISGIGGGIGRQFGKPKEHDENREGTILQNRHDVTDGQALARLRSESREDLGSACCR